MSMALSHASATGAVLQRQAVSHTRNVAPIRRSLVTARRVERLLTRAEGDNLGKKAEGVVEQAEDAFNQQKDQVKDQVQKPLSEGKAATDPNNSWDQSIKEAGKNETEKLGTEISIPDALRFRGVGPEHINSRLAMIGVTTGYLTKLITGKNTLDQYQAAPLPVVLTFIVFIAASLIPITKGVTPEKAQSSFWSAKAEIYNGRLAMIGFISLIATDGWQWFSALQAAKGANLS